MVTTTNTASPPGTIIAAFFGFLVSTVTALTAGAVLLGARQAFIDALRESNQRSGQAMTEEQLQNGAVLAQAFAIGVVVVVALVYLWLSFKLKAGRNWARVVLTIITLLQAASLFATQGNTTISYVSCAVAVVALVLSYMPPSNAYIAAVKHGR